jgi:hypothetical protein
MGAVLSWKNWAEQPGVGVTVSSQAPGLGPAGMLTPQIQNVWRSGTWNNVTSVTVDLNLTTNRQIKTIAFAAPRDGLLPPSGSTVALTASTSSEAGTDALNVAAAAFTLNPWGVWAWRSATGINARYIRLRFVGTATSSYIQLGRIWAGDALITKYSYGYGQGLSFRDPGTSTRAGITGVRYATRGLPYRVERIGFPILSQTEASTLVSAVGEVGTTGQVFFAREEEYLGDGMFGTFSDAPVVNRQLEDMWTTDFQIEEDA